MTRRAEKQKTKMILLNMIFNTSTGAVGPRHLKVQDTEQDQGTTEIIASLSACKNPCFQQCCFVEILLLKNLYQFTQSCFQNSFRLVFYTSLTLRHCNTLSSINNSPTTKATLPNVPTLTSYTLLTSVQHVCSTQYSAQHPTPTLF